MSRIDVHFVRAHVKDGNSDAAPLLGEGTLELQDEGVRFRGRRTREIVATFAGVTVGLLGVLVAAFFLTESGAEPTKKVALAVGLVCGILPGIGAYTLLHNYLRGPFVDVLVSWSALRVLQRDEHRCTLRLVAPELRGDVVAVAADAASAKMLSALSGRSPLRS